MGIYHAFVSTKANPANTPTNQLKSWAKDWDDDHYHPDFLMMSIVCHGANMVAYPVPLALTELFGVTRFRFKYDLTYVDQIRLTAAVFAASKTNTTEVALRAQWSGDGGATWNYFDGVTGPSCKLDRVGTPTSGWINTSAASRAAGDAFIRLVTVGGDGVTNMKLGLVQLHVY